MLTKQPNRTLCLHCKLSLSKPNGVSKHGFIKWHKYCSSCAKFLYNEKYKHLNYKKFKCEKCHFIAKDKCQLDLVYKDGNKQNKNKDNLKTLCANCSKIFNKNLKLRKKSILDITVDSDVIL